MSIPGRASMLWQNIQANGFGMYAVTIWERIVIIFWLRIETYPICFLFISVFPLGQMRFLISFCVASFCRFRKLFVSFSSYTYVNTLRKIEELKQSWRNILKRISTYWKWFSDLFLCWFVCFQNDVSSIEFQYTFFRIFFHLYQLNFWNFLHGLLAPANIYLKLRLTDNHRITWSLLIDLNPWSIVLRTKDHLEQKWLDWWDYLEKWCHRK